VSEDSLLQIRNASKAFGTTHALQNVSLDIKENEFFALLGPSGCGKTTLLRALAGFESLDSGEIQLEGQDLLTTPANRRPVNLMFQSYALFPHLSVYENIAYGLKREKLSKDEISTRVDEVLVTVGLSELAKRRPAQLSGGQKQRVALARAIVKKPKILLLDEPLSALDRKVRTEMQLELKRLQTEVGITFIIVTHDQEEAMSMADRIAVMNDGEIVQIATPFELYSNPRNTFVADFIGTSNLLSGVLNNSTFHLQSDLSVPCSHSNTNDRVLWMLRPEDIQVSHDAGIEAKVLNSNFFGAHCLLLVDCGLEKPVKLYVANTSVPKVGSTLNITWEPDAGVLLNEG
jgi:spermidine/putrescine transport system ATP-binding protein/putrescine transport system ATP-binding protein